MSNLFADLPSDLPKELIEVLTENKHVRIERIVSTGHSSLAGRIAGQRARSKDRITGFAKSRLFGLNLREIEAGALPRLAFRVLPALESRPATAFTT